MAALVAFGMVGVIAPKDVSMVGVEFAHDTSDFTTALLIPGDSDVRFETVTMVRAHLAADMVFLVAYGLLLRASVRLRSATPFARLAANGAVLAMLADAAENIFALKLLRALGEGTRDAQSWWFVAMNVASATKWAVAGLVLVSLAVIVARDTTPPAGWRRRVTWTMAAAFAIGGVASLAVASSVTIVFPKPVVFGMTIDLQWLVATTALLAPAIGFLLQFRLLDQIGLMLRFAYLARVPFVVLVIMAAFGPLALGPIIGLLGGILVASNFTGIFVTTVAAIALLFACGTQINVVRAYAEERMQDRTVAHLREKILSFGTFWTGVVAVSSLLFSVGLASPAVGGWTIAGGVMTGTVVALALLFAIEWLAALLANDSARDRVHLAVPFDDVPTLHDLLDKARRKPAPGFKEHLVASFVSRLFGLGTGYVEIHKGKRRILPGHTFATIQFVITFIVFWVTLFLKSRPDQQFFIPTVTSIVLLLLLSSWAFAAVAFFFDRYRTPLFTAALAMGLLTGSRSCTDHLVSITDGGGEYTLATPGAVLTAFGARPLVVAAAGGGIQAGAWTARVLQGLDAHLKGSMRQRVAAISAVSGASMGALYYGAYDGSDGPMKATQQALKPSLDEIATALVGHDVFRVIGLRFGNDRGAALEESWRLRLPDEQAKHATLRTWSERARDFAASKTAPPFPAFLFNTTIVESGQPVAFATTQNPTRTYRSLFKTSQRQYPIVESANRVFRFATKDDGPARDVGIKAVTAARLSAAFPYVSPASALGIPGAEPFHLVDGGYYDVYGLVALSQWLDDALEEMARKAARPDEMPKEIGVVIARGLASSDSALLTRLRSDDPTTVSLDGAIESQGWRWQLTAPPLTALHARTFGQWAGDVQILRLLIDKWEKRGVPIVPYVFDYPGFDRTPVCQGSPLSWKLTDPQQQCIEDAWTTFEKDPGSPLHMLH